MTNQRHLGQLEKAVNLIFQNKINLLKTKLIQERRQFTQDIIKKVKKSKDLIKLQNYRKQALVLKEKLYKEGFTLYGISDSPIEVDAESYIYQDGTSVPNPILAKWDKDHAVDYDMLELKRLELIASLYGNDTDFKALTEQINQIFAKLG